MLRFSARLFGAALILALGAAASASAGTVTATYTGTVDSGVDTTGVFGTPSADLAGAGYSLAFTIDPAVGDYSTFNGTITDPLLSGDQIFGGISAVLTINGHSYDFAGIGSPTGNYDIAATKPGFGVIVQQFGANLSSSGNFAYVTATLLTTNPRAFRLPSTRPSR